MKRISLFILLISLLLNTVCYAANNVQDINKRYWPLQEAYIVALDASDLDNIIKYGTQIYNLFVGDNDPNVMAERFLAGGDIMELNILSSTLENVAKAYEKKGDYANAAEYYELLLPFAKAFRETIKGDPARYADYDYKLTEINSKIKNLDTDITLYTKIKPNFYTNPYTGAMFEPRNGVYYGRAFTGIAKDDKNQLMSNNPKKESAKLIYVHFGSEKFSDYDWIFKNVKANRSVVELAWNLVNEGSDLKDFQNKKDFIIKEAQYLKAVDMPILLRFGAEMNLWNNAANPEDYISAFRLVSTIMKEYAPNVAMLWSPNDINAAFKTYSMFYPGDDYVDWVGISTYTIKYFANIKDQSEAMQALYMSGDYANPIEKIRPIVEEYGAKKPIILSECGVSNYALTYKEDLTAWALHYLNFFYCYVPMVFPEVKAILYFDKNFEGGSEPNHYSLYGNDQLNQKYAQLTNDSIFLANGKTEPDYIYKLIDNVGMDAASVTLYPYFFLPKLQNPTITYQIDGEWVSKKTEVPYNTVLNMSNLSDGNHSLTLTLSDGDKTITSEPFTIIKTGNTVKIIDPEKPVTEKISQWAIPYVGEAIDKGLVPNTLQDKYKQSINRFEFCNLIITFIEQKSKKSIDLFMKDLGIPMKENPFTDTGSKSVLAAYLLGIVNGKGEGSFAPFANITREEAAKMLALTAKVVGCDISAKGTSFADDAAISAWARDFIGYVSGAKIMNGKDNNMFDPKGLYTREEAIKTILQLYNTN